MTQKKRARGPGRPQALTRNREEPSFKHSNMTKRKKLIKMNPGYSFFIDEFGVIQYLKKGK